MGDKGKKIMEGVIKKVKIVLDFKEWSILIEKEGRWGVIFSGEMRVSKSGKVRNYLYV